MVLQCYLLFLQTSHQFQLNTRVTVKTGLLNSNRNVLIPLRLSLRIFSIAVSFPSGHPELSELCSCFEAKIGDGKSTALLKDAILCITLSACFHLCWDKSHRTDSGIILEVCKNKNEINKSNFMQDCWMSRRTKTDIGHERFIIVSICSCCYALFY